MANLIIEKITHSFSSSPILNCDYTEIKSNKITALIGRNGEGKSTFFRIVYGDLKANYSRIFYENGMITKCYTKSELIAFLPQDNLIPSMIKVKNFIELALIRDEYKIKLEKRFEKSINKKIGTLSGGEKRLLEILYVIYLERRFTLLDEPYKGLAPKQIDEINKVINESKRAIIISSHLFSDLNKVADEIILMRNGNLHIIDNIDSLTHYNYLPSNNKNLQEPT